MACEAFASGAMMMASALKSARTGEPDMDQTGRRTVRASRLASLPDVGRCCRHHWPQPAPNLDDASQEPIAVAVRRIAAKPVARKRLARRSLTYPMPGNGSAQRLRWDIRHVTVLAAMLLGVPEATQLRHHNFT